MNEIKPLTSLRGIAAMAVVMQHFSATAQQLCRVSIPSLIPHGYMGVDLFFALSGFIMSYTYLEAFKKSGWSAFPAFIGKRVARVVPLNIVVLLLLMFMGLTSVICLGRNIFFKSDNILFDLATNLLMLQGLGIGTNLNGPSWSISTEFCAYILFPILVGLVFDRRKEVMLFAVLMAVLILCWEAWSSVRLGLATESIDFQVIRCFTEFTIGIGSYRLFRAKGAAQWLGRDGVTFTLAGGMFLFMALRIDLFVALLCPLLIVSVAANTGLMAKFLSTQILYSLGVISYSVYLIHNLFRPIWLEIFRGLDMTTLSPVAALSVALIGSLVVIPFAWLTYYSVELPGRTAARSLMTRIGLTIAKAT